MPVQLPALPLTGMPVLRVGGSVMVILLGSDHSLIADDGNYVDVLKVHALWPLRCPERTCYMARTSLLRIAPVVLAYEITLVSSPLVKGRRTLPSVG